MINHPELLKMWHGYPLSEYLTYCGLVMASYGVINLCQHWFLLSVGSCDIHVRATTQEIPQPSIIKFSLKIAYFKFSVKSPRGQSLLIAKFIFQVSLLFSITGYMKLPSFGGGVFHWSRQTQFSVLIDHEKVYWIEVLPEFIPFHN